MSLTSTKLNGKAILFGLNYKYCPKATLNGCINDVQMMSKYLQDELSIPVTVFTDEADRDACSGVGIVQRLSELATASYRENLDFAWIHYSGHGCFVIDKSGDERDQRDECLVPSDFERSGFILDDTIGDILGSFNPNTRVVCVFDCCHSGTIGDVKYSWEGPQNAIVENILCNVDAKVITISGCLDTQSSADAYNVLGDKKFSGALTACLLSTLRETGATGRRNVFMLVDVLRKKLSQLHFEQVPKLCSTFNLAKDPLFIPLL